MTAAATDGREGRDDAGLLDAARSLLRESEVLDLHIDTLIPPRLWGRDPLLRHGPGLLRGRFFGHLDLPRLTEAGVGSAMWSITTNPFRTAAGRWKTFLRNLADLEALAARSGGALRICRTHAEVLAARKAGAHACLPAIQGGNALEAAPEGPASIPGGLVTRVTLVHLTSSVYGRTSSPLTFVPSDAPLTPAGVELVRRLDEARVFVDLAHISPRAFHDAVRAHDPSLPLLVTHTGVAGVRPHWRNVDDLQIRAVAATGGTVGVIAADQFLRRKGGPAGADRVLEHLEHVCEVAGDDFASIGTDFDGAITPPEGLRDGATAYPYLVARMLARGWSDDRIRKVLGANALRALAALRP